MAAGNKPIAKTGQANPRLLRDYHVEYMHVHARKNFASNNYSNSLSRYFTKQEDDDGSYEYLKEHALTFARS